MIKWESIAKLKIFKDRFLGWAVFINFILLIFTNQGIQLSLIHIIFLGCLVILIAYLDMKYILPKEQEYFFKRNPEWQRRND